MGTQNTVIQIEKMFFEDGDVNATIIGRINTGYLHYQTEIMITMTELNRVLNHLQSINPNADLYQYIIYTSINELESFIEADFTELFANEVPTYLFEDIQNVKEIRA